MKDTELEAIRTFVVAGLSLTLQSTRYDKNYGTRIQGRIVSVQMHPTESMPKTLTLENGTLINADLVDFKEVFLNINGSAFFDAVSLFKERT